MENNQQLIDRYLQQEMSAGEKEAFEARLAADPELAGEFSVQQKLVQAITREGIRQEFAKAIRKQVLMRHLIRWGLAAVVVVAGVLTFLAIKNNWFAGERNKTEAVTSITPERFEINTAADTIIETRDGAVFAIPAGAFKTESQTVQLEIRTALDAASIIRNGLSTVSNGDLLQTAGMFYINGYENGTALPLQKQIAVSVPARQVNPAMQLFDGVEDSNGQVNWVNPKPVEKKLRTVDITTLDFYPPDYLPVLKALQKDYRNKKYTDSLYYSFSGYGRREVFPAVVPGNETIPVDSTAAKAEEYFPADTNKLPAKKDTAVKSPYWDQVEVVSTDSVRSFYPEIDPARIKAIWNKRFNNTLLATREFEERLQYIHGLCNPIYLDAYLHGLNRPMYETDEKLANLSSGEVRQKFLEFAARRDGMVQVAEGMQEKLNQYVEQKIKAYREAAAKTRAAYQAELDKLEQIADEKGRQQAMAEFVSANTRFTEEFCINLTEAYRQVGIKRSCKDTPVAPGGPSYNFTISTTGWNNLDIYVIEATKDRQSMTYTDPATGKIAKLTYAGISIRIEEEQQFDTVLVYLVPDSLSTFQRVKRSGGEYKEQLNSLFRYDVLALAYRGGETFFYQQQAVPPGNYTFRLNAISEPALQQRLNIYQGGKNKVLQQEAAYQIFVRQELMRQVQLQKDLEFRQQVLAAIFKCARSAPAVK